MEPLSHTPLLSPLNTSLYVGDLDPSVTELIILQAFARALVPLKSIRLCMDRVTGKSLCYAYVNFYSNADAYMAMSALNHTYLCGKPMRIMWSQRNPVVRKSGDGNIFIKNLHPTVESAALEAIFAKFGPILSAKVAEENGVSKGFGFVQFMSEESATNAIQTLDGTLLLGKKIYVTKFKRQAERQQPGSKEQPSFTNLYVKNLDDDMTEDLLRDKFSEFGKVSSVAVMKDDLGKSKGFGFVCFESSEEAENAIASLNGAELGSMKIFVGKAQTKAERIQALKQQNEDSRKKPFEKYKDSSVFVKNLADSVDNVKLGDTFSTCGRVVSTKVLHYGNGVSRGVGFVCFSTPDEARNAVATVHGTMLQGKPLHVSIAKRKEDRKPQLSGSSQVGSLFPSGFGFCAPPGYNSIMPIVSPLYPSTFEYIAKSNSQFHSSETQRNQKSFPAMMTPVDRQPVVKVVSHKVVRQQQCPDKENLVIEKLKACFPKKVYKEKSGGKPSSIGSEFIRSIPAPSSVKSCQQIHATSETHVTSHKR